MERRAVTAERAGRALPGLLMLIVIVAFVAGGIALMATGSSIVVSGDPSAGAVAMIVGGVLLILGAVLLSLGMFVLQPNQAEVVILFGKYKGTVQRDGWFWVNPFTIGQRKKISLRVRNFNSDTLKVNDERGNPVEIAAVVVWRVHDTAKAVFDVDDYQHFVKVQSETAVRHLAQRYPYDAYEDDLLSLSGNVDEISEALQVELQERLANAGVAVLEARLSHLSYSPEIAGAMLRRQQATAIVAARQRIVEGAVGMVEHALEMLERSHVVELDQDKKAAMISNLLVVLTGEQAAQPVVNTGTLYQ